MLGKWGTESITDGLYKGEGINPEKFSHLLEEYYQLRGWDSDGIPTKATLKALALNDIARDIARIKPGAKTR